MGTEVIIDTQKSSFAKWTEEQENLVLQLLIDNEDMAQKELYQHMCNALFEKCGVTRSQRSVSDKLSSLVKLYKTDASSLRGSLDDDEWEHRLNLLKNASEARDSRETTKSSRTKEDKEKPEATYETKADKQTKADKSKADTTLVFDKDDDLDMVEPIFTSEKKERREKKEKKEKRVRSQVVESVHDDQETTHESDLEFEKLPKSVDEASFQIWKHLQWVNLEKYRMNKEAELQRQELELRAITMREQTKAKMELAERLIKAIVGITDDHDVMNMFSSGCEVSMKDDHPVKKQKN